MSNGNQPSTAESQPDSTIAKNFSDQLDGLFNMGGEVPTLAAKIQEKKETITTQSKELEEIEARLRAADEALKKASDTTETVDVDVRKEVRSIHTGTPTGHPSARGTTTTTTTSSTTAAGSTSAPQGVASADFGTKTAAGD